MTSSQTQALQDGMVIPPGSSSLISVHHFSELVLDLVEHARCMDALGKIPGLQQVRTFVGYANTDNQRRRRL
jgi:hypothetical protein